MYGEMLCIREKERINVLEEMNKLGRIFKADVRCSISEIEEILENIKSKVGANVEEFIQEVNMSIKGRECTDLAYIWKKALRGNLKKSYLKEEDFEVLDRFGENLGCLDRQMQIDNAEFYINEISEHIKNVSNNLKEKSKVYKSISVSVGICIVLMLI